MNRPKLKMKGNEAAREQMLALFENDEAVKNLLQKTVQEVLETEMNEALGACKGERTKWRRGYARRNAAEARADLTGWLERWQNQHPRPCAWMEANIEETFTYYRLPLEHHKHLKSTNLLEQLNQEFKRRTHIVRIFPDEPGCLRLVRSLAVGTHEDWIDGSRRTPSSLGSWQPIRG
jgi:transposase-like protein